VCVCVCVCVCLWGRVCLCECACEFACVGVQFMCVREGVIGCDWVSLCVWGGGFG